MQYILSEEEMIALVNKDNLIECKEEKDLLLEIFKSNVGCLKEEGGYCDSCPVATLNSHVQFCKNEKYSK